jgi:hypothetical protein
MDLIGLSFLVLEKYGLMIRNIIYDMGLKSDQNERIIVGLWNY